MPLEKSNIEGCFQSYKWGVIELNISLQLDVTFLGQENESLILLKFNNFSDYFYKTSIIV